MKTAEQEPSLHTVTDSLKSDKAQRIDTAIVQAADKYAAATAALLDAKAVNDAAMTARRKQLDKVSSAALKFTATRAKAETAREKLQTVRTAAQTVLGAATTEAKKNAAKLRLEKAKLSAQRADKAVSSCEATMKKEYRALTAVEKKATLKAAGLERTVVRETSAYEKLLQAVRKKVDYLQTILASAGARLASAKSGVGKPVAGSEKESGRTQTDERLIATLSTEKALVTAALSDVKTKLRTIEKSRQEQDKKRHNPAPRKASSRGSITDDALAEEIVAILVEADKVKKSEQTVPETETVKAAPKKTAQKKEAPKKEAAKKEAPKAAAPAAATNGRYRLKAKFADSVIPELVKKFNYKNVNEVPRLEKILLNMGLGDVKDDGKKFNAAVEELKIIAGQKPAVTKAKKSIANFKLRQGMPIGAKVTLRGNRMYEFLDKLISIALPRVRDFKGVNPNSFDGRGNYAMGVKEQLIFPEIKYDQIDKIRGFDIVVVTSAHTDEEAKELLKLLGVPFRA